MADYGAQLGAGGLIACPSNAVYDFGTGDFTLTALVKGHAPGVVVSRKGEQGPGWILWIEAGGTIVFTTDNGVGYYEAVTNPTDVLDDYWHHIAAIRQVGQLTIYLDGVQVQAGVRFNQPTPLDVSNQTRLLMGNTDQGMNRQFIGLIEDVTVWNRALSKTEIIPTRYNQLTGQEPGLVGFWPMDGNLNDASPTKNNGVATGSVGFDQIFHCDPAYGGNDYAFVSIANEGTAGARTAASVAGPVTRRQEVEVTEGTPSLLGALVTGVTDFTFPQGAILKITGPGGTVYDQDRNDDMAYVQMQGGSVRIIAVHDPQPGTWIVETTAPGDLTFQLLFQTVPSSNVAGTVRQALQPIYGSEGSPTAVMTDAGSTLGWAFMAAATVGLGILTIATLGATAPVLLGALAAVAVLDTAIVVAAAQQIPEDQPASVFVDAAANMCQFEAVQNVIVQADANSDDATKMLYVGRVEFYGFLTTKAFRRVRLKGTKFTSDAVNAELQQPGVRYFTASAHGQPSYILGGDGHEVLWVGRYPAAAADGKVFHLLSCRAGGTLGRDLVSNGATAFFGYNAPFQLLVGERYGFIYCDSVVDYQLVEGRTAGEAQSAAVAQFNRQIKAFEDQGKHNAATVLQLDLEMFVGPSDAGYGNPDARIV